jgi:peroxiredoxin
MTRHLLLAGLVASSLTAGSALAQSARIGAPAPDFSLVDLDGKTVKLSDFKGKTVVLEWFNPGCPYVMASHSKGSLVGAAERATKNGAVWLAINSGAPGKQGHGVETNRAAARNWGMKHPVLLDESGKTGKAYGASNTPHMFVIDKSGALVYRGAIDNSPDGEGESPTGGKLVKHVEAALTDVAAGRPVQTPETRAYGCSVKYGS